MTWNFNISDAPRGETASKTITVGVNEDGTDKTREYREFYPDWIWIATNCGKVLKSHWKPKDKFGGDRFIGLNKGEQPVAWQHFIVPVHPNFSVKGAERQTEAAE